MPVGLKYALRNIKWYDILNLLNINLSLLVDCRINYWTPEQVKDMYLAIDLLFNDPYMSLYSGYKSDELDEEIKSTIQKVHFLKDDIKKLMEYFKVLVDNDAYIYVY